MTSRTPKSLAEYATEAARQPDGRIVCPDCGCEHFEVYGTPNVGRNAVQRYKVCRHCGHKVLTSTVSIERIIRSVKPHAKPVDDDEGDDPTTIQLHA